MWNASSLNPDPSKFKTLKTLRRCDSSEQQQVLGANLPVYGSLLMAICFQPVKHSNNAYIFTTGHLRMYLLNLCMIFLQILTIDTSVTFPLPLQICALINYRFETWRIGFP
jgi:hypothetical protein